MREARQGQLLGDRVAADDRLRLQHQHLEAGRGQVGGADQPVVAGADHDDVGGSGSGAMVPPEELVVGSPVRMLCIRLQQTA